MFFLSAIKYNFMPYIEVSECMATCLIILFMMISLPNLYRGFSTNRGQAESCSLYICTRSCSVVSDSLRSHGLQPTRLLCPWDSPGKNTGVGCHFLLQGSFLIQGSNQCFVCLVHWQVGSITLVPPGKPIDRQIDRYTLYII